MSVVAVFNQKGGVGKTTTTFNLAAALARGGSEPLALDLDAQASLTQACGVFDVPNGRSVDAFFRADTPLHELVVPTGVGIRLIPAHYDLTKVDALFGNNRAISGHLRRGLAQHLGRLGRPILIDCSPSLGVLTLNAILAARRVLVPVAADWMSLRAVERFNAALSVLGPRLPAGFQRRVVVTRFDPRRRLSHEIHARLREMFGADLCAQRIGECVALAESPARGQDIFRYAPHSQAARDYAGLHEELCATGFFAAELVAKAA